MRGKEVGEVKPKKIFIGIDASGDPGFKEGDLTNTDWFAISAVLTNEFQSAEDANREITERYGNRKGKQLHKHFNEINKILLKYPFRYFVFFYNKYNCPDSIAKRWQEVYTSDSPSDDFKYTMLTKKFSKHGWLTVDSLIKAGYKGDVEIRIDEDLKGNAWRQYRTEVKAHVENHIGNCDIETGDDSHPLIRIADIFANQLRTQAKKNNLPRFFSEFYPHVVPMLLFLEEIGGKVKIEMRAFHPKNYEGFFPW